MEVYPALAEALGRVVMPLAVADPARLPAYAVVCDVWEAPGLVPTVVDCYGVPESLPELRAASPRWPGCWAATACCADDTLDAGRHLLVAPDGTIRPVHFDVADTDDGEVLSRPPALHAGAPGLPGLVAVPPLALGTRHGRPGPAAA